MIELGEPFQLFDPEECQYYIELAEKQGLESGQTYSKDPAARTNYVSWVELKEHHYGHLWNLGKEFGATWFEHPVQISRYGPNEFYNWHKDTKPNTKRSSVRHITLTCTLKSAPDAIFETIDRTYNLTDGQAIIFNSDMFHHASAPTLGFRWALTVWFMAPNSTNI